MENKICYLDFEKMVEVKNEDVFLKDLGSVYCADKVLFAKLCAMKVYHFPEGREDRVMLEVMDLLPLIEETAPGVQVECLGEIKVLLERKTKPVEKAWVSMLKIIFISCISFFGTAFTIIGFHVDINIRGIFDTVYLAIMGNAPGKVNPLEIGYSVGLALGIILFFNHVGPKRITKDPTPIEVSMVTYSRDLEDTLLDNATQIKKEKKS